MRDDRRWCLKLLGEVRSSAASSERAGDACREQGKSKLWVLVCSKGANSKAAVKRHERKGCVRDTYRRVGIGKNQSSQGCMPGRLTEEQQTPGLLMGARQHKERSSTTMQARDGSTGHSQRQTELRRVSSTPVGPAGGGGTTQPCCACAACRCIAARWVAMTVATAATRPSGS